MLKSQEIHFINQVLITFSTRVKFDEKGIDELSIFNDFTQFDLLKNYEHIEYYSAFQSLLFDSEAKIIFARITYPIPSTKTAQYITDLQVVAVKFLEDDYGEIQIRPETFEDKIREFFKSIELDFPDFPEFSKKYYFITENKDLARKFAKPKLLELLEKIDGIFIQVKGRILVAKFNSIANITNCKALLDLIEVA